MAGSEAARHQLYNELGTVLSPESTSELMSLLPPFGWADMATKQDLAALEGRLQQDLRAEIADFRAEVADAMRKQTFSLVGVMVTLYGIAWATFTFGT